MEYHGKPSYGKRPEEMQERAEEIAILINTLEGTELLRMARDLPPRNMEVVINQVIKTMLLSVQEAGKTLGQEIDKSHKDYHHKMEELRNQFEKDEAIYKQKAHEISTMESILEEKLRSGIQELKHFNLKEHEHNRGNQ